MSDLLDAEKLAARCRSVGDGLVIELVDETASTNADLRQRIDQLRVPVLRVAEQQSAGRGRAGREWRAARGDSLCFSLAWPFSRGLMQLAGLPLAVGVALADTLRALNFPATLKWPNDLLLEGAKLGGVLVETGVARIDGSETVWAVVGVGLNVHPNAIRDTAVPHDVAALGENIDRNALLATLTDALVGALRLFDSQGLAPFIDRWQRWHAFAGLSVCVMDQGKLLHEGVARGIDAAGCLQLETDAGLVAIAAGDLSLRALSTNKA
jgi:BirA family biotin operon repressor/biotin-[acetyl-CoA-carboxylase] ligase